MAVVKKTTSDIRYSDSWVTVQQFKTAANQFSDAPPLDDVGGGGAGPFLVFEKGIWKYPQQAAGGRFAIPGNTGRPVRLVGMMANFGAGTATYAIHIAGIDNTAGGPDNTSGTPYAAGNAALYREGDIIIDSGSNVQYVSKNYDPQDAGSFALIHPGQRVYVVTTNASAGLIRLTFSSAVENTG